MFFFPPFTIFHLLSCSSKQLLHCRSTFQERSGGHNARTNQITERNTHHINTHNEHNAEFAGVVSLDTHNTSDYDGTAQHHINTHNKHNVEFAGMVSRDTDNTSDYEGTAQHNADNAETE
jgi:hypothetical protein